MLATEIENNRLKDGRHASQNKQSPYLLGTQPVNRFTTSSNTSSEREVVRLRQGERDRVAQKALATRRAQEQQQQMTPGQRVDLLAQKLNDRVNPELTSKLLNHPKSTT